MQDTVQPLHWRLALAILPLSTGIGLVQAQAESQAALAQAEAGGAEADSGSNTGNDPPAGGKDATEPDKPKIPPAESAAPW